MQRLWRQSVAMARRLPVPVVIRCLSVPARVAPPSATRLTSKHISWMLTESGKRRDGEPYYRHVLVTWDLHGEQFDDINLAHALSCVGRAAAQIPEGPARERMFSGSTGCSLRRLLQRVSERLQHLRARELATVMHASSALPDELARGIVNLGAARVQMLAPQLTPQGLCLVTGACAKLGITHQPMLDAVAAAASRSLTSFTMQDISILTWACAKLNARCDSLFAQIATVAPAKLTSGPVSTQSLANVAWAYARSNVAAPQLLDELGARAFLRVGEFKPFELAMLLWALARRRRPHASLFEAAAEHLERKIEKLPPRSVSNVAWAYATADIRNEQVSLAPFFS